MPVALAMSRVGGKGYNNRHPRLQQSQLTGWGYRALSAHQNTIEALPIFAAGVFIAHLGGADPRRAATFAIAHTVARVLYPILYITDTHYVRSLVWGVGYLSALALALSPAF
jgi:uncharacterized MAPEG superfamily protein